MSSQPKKKKLKAGLGELTAAKETYPTVDVKSTPFSNGMNSAKKELNV